MWYGPGVTAEPRPAAIAAPSPPLFVVLLGAWMAVATVWISISLSQKHGWTPRCYFPPIAAVILLLMGPWVGASTGFWMLLKRSLAAHAMAPILPTLLFAAARSSDPGASGHGGVFTMLLFGLPYVMAASMLIALPATVTSYGVMRAMRRA